MFRIGAIADVQYADRSDAPPRYYRASLDKFRTALEAFNPQDLSFVVLLGDLVDKGWMNYAAVLEVAKVSRHPLRYVLGNHDFKVASSKKRRVPEMLGMPGRYYAFAVEDWIFVVLDGTEISSYAHPDHSPEREEALELRRLYPPTKAGNGGIGKVQRLWLEEILLRADENGQKVAMCCHFPVISREHQPTLLLNAAEMRTLIGHHPSARLWLNGHRHDGSYHTQIVSLCLGTGHVPGPPGGPTPLHAQPRSRHVIHHLNLKGMVETAEMAGVVLEFHSDRIVVQGMGREPSRVLKL